MPRINAPTVAEHHAHQRARILDSAARLFAQRGVQAVSMSEIAADAGLRRSSLYRYFAGRDELVVALFERDQSDYLTRSELLLTRNAPPLRRLLDWADDQLAYVAEPAHAIGNQVLSEAAALSPDAAEAIREGHRALLRSVRDTIAEQLGEGRAAETGALTEFVAATVLAASRLAVLQGPSPELRQTLRRTLQAMLEAR